MKLVIAPTAYQDLQRVYSFIQKENPTALRRAADRLEKAFRTLLDYPLAGYELEDLTLFRELIAPFGKGNYIIRYRIKDDTLFIVHLWHNREERET